MLNCENIMLVGLISIIIIIVVLMYQKNSINRNNVLENNVVENFSTNMNNSGFNPRISGSSNSYKDKYDELKKYMEIQGMYPMGQAQDMSKFVLKSEVAKEERCADMSKYTLKSSVPQQVQCPTINRDEWLRKTELPPNWNKDCPAHPDLTNFVLKSTIPPNQKCPSCICPKIKIDAALCKEPTKDDCVAKDLCKDACPSPKPCPKPVCPPPDPLTPEKCAGVIKCPEPKPCPPPPEKICPRCPPIPQPAPCPRPPPPPACPKPTCPSCPKPKTKGECPKPERCPPSQDCPKCYGVKYVKVPVVRSEPLPKPEKQTIFPQNTIETKLLRQHVPSMPRQPRIVKLEQDIPEAAEETMAPMASIDDSTTLLQSLLEKMDQLTAAQRPAPVPSQVIENNQNINEPVMAPSIASNNNFEPLSAPSPSIQNNRNNVQNNRNNVQNNRNNVQNNRNLQERNNMEVSAPEESPERCGVLNLNNTFQRFGIKGFNNSS